MGVQNLKYNILCRFNRSKDTEWIPNLEIGHVTQATLPVVFTELGWLVEVRASPSGYHVILYWQHFYYCHKRWISQVYHNARDLQQYRPILSFTEHPIPIHSSQHFTSIPLTRIARLWWNHDISLLNNVSSGTNLTSCSEHIWII